MSKKEEKKKFFGLSERKFEKIVKSAAREANKEQRELVEKYERKFGKSEQPQGVCDSVK